MTWDVYERPTVDVAIANELAIRRPLTRNRFDGYKASVGDKTRAHEASDQCGQHRPYEKAHGSTVLTARK